MNPKILLTCFIIFCWKPNFAQSEIDNPLSAANAVAERVGSLTISSYAISSRPSSDAVETYTYDSLGNLISLNIVHTNKKTIPTNYVFKYEGSALRKTIMSYESTNYKNYTTINYNKKGGITLITDSAIIVKLIEAITRTYYQYANDTAFIFTIDNNGDTLNRKLKYTNPIDSSIYTKNLETNTENITNYGLYGSYESRNYKNEKLKTSNTKTYNASHLLIEDISYYNNTTREIHYSENPRYVIERTIDSNNKVVHHVKTLTDTIHQMLTTITYTGSDSTVERESLAAHLDHCKCACVLHLRYHNRYVYINDTLTAALYSGDYIIKTFRVDLVEKSRQLVHTIRM